MEERTGELLTQTIQKATVFWSSNKIEPPIYTFS